MKLRLLTSVAAWLMAATLCTAAAVWTDVTQAFITNATFDEGNTDGWITETQGGTVGPSAGCMRFYDTTCTLSQQLNNLPKGKYRLSVQGFYRAYGDSYEAFTNGSENITAYLFAGDNATKLRSVYSEGLRWQGTGNWQIHNDQYYPDNSLSANYAFENRLYEGNTLEFEAEGNITIGIRCEQRESQNYCVFDNFKLEYYGETVKVSGVELKLDNTKLIVGETATINATMTPAHATAAKLTWTSDNKKVATVDQKGVVTAVGEGTAVITATVNGNATVKGKLTITVEHSQASAGSIVINEIMASNIDEYISPAFNFDGWMELYNPTDKAVELGGLRISDSANKQGPWTTPVSMGILPAKGYRVIWFDSNDIAPENAPFKLDTDGGTIVITDANKQEIASLEYPASMERISYARSTDGTGEWGFTGTATPGTSNNGIKQFTEQLAAPVVDQPSQLYKDSFTVKVTIPKGCTLRYTSDGSLPTLDNGQTSKDGVFEIQPQFYTWGNEVWVWGNYDYRFRLFADDKLPSTVTTRSFIYKEYDYYLPVVSVVTDQNFIYSQEIGVFSIGPNGRPGNGQSQKCNWNMNWERPVNFSYLDENGQMVINQDVNLEMCGGWSRAWTPHAFKLKGSKEMGGNKDLLYPFFKDKPYIRNRTLQIRNGGNDTQCRIKDPALQYIVQTSGFNIDCQSYQPVHEFINGEYIGVLNVREPNNKHYVYANYGWDDDEIDQFEMSPDSGYVQKCGTPDAFYELVDVLSPDAADANTYAEICKRLDMDAYINYMAIQMYLGNTDWPQNNVKGFRHRDGGKFRFVLFDLDHSFNTSSSFSTFLNKERYQFDQLYPTSLGRITDQIRFVTLFKNLLNNKDFCRQFVDAFCIVGGSVYEKSRATAIIDEMVNYVEPAMNMDWGSARSTANQLKSSLNSRNSSLTNTLRNTTYFNIKNTTRQTVTLNSDTKGARITINGQEVPTGSFNGTLFAPVTLRAMAPGGCVFKAWINDNTGAVHSTEPEISLPSDNTVKLTATFTRLSYAEAKAKGVSPIRINEVSGSNDSYIDEYGKKGDWVELYNTTDADMDIEGMFLTDDLAMPTKYKITKGDTKANTVIPAQGYLVIWCDNKRSTTDNGLHASFKIDGDGGLVAISAVDQSWSDVMAYGAHDAQTTIGRYPDGASDVYAMSAATIGHSNIRTSYMTPDNTPVTGIAADRVMAQHALQLSYAARHLLVSCSNSRQVAITINRTDGVLAAQTMLNTASGSAHFDTDSLEPGFYVARATDDNGNTVSCKFVKR